MQKTKGYMTKKWESWNKNIVHNIEHIYYPTTEVELAEKVQHSKSIRVVGNGQSSSDIAAGTTAIISLEKYCAVTNVDRDQYKITIEAGSSLKGLLEAIQHEGWTLPALPDIDTITVGGALATATHGTGHDARILAQYMIACRFVNADGTVAEYTEFSEEFDAIRVSLGVLGIFSTVTFRCEPLWNLQLEERPMKDRDWLKSYLSMLDNHRFLRILWLPHTNYGYVITGDIADSPSKQIEIPWYVKYRRSLSAKLYRRTVKKPRFTVTANKIIQKLFFNHSQNKFGSLYDATVTKSRGSTLELAEWIVSLDRFEALFHDLKDALNDLSNDAYAHIPMDIRFLRNDKSWLSYAYGQDCVSIGCVSRIAEVADQYEAFAVIETVFRRHGGRPHWAKRHKMAGDEFSELYPKWNNFIALREKLDPSGKFLNAYLTKLLGL
ncbi:dehydrogenase [Psychromonas sp. MB-3u-54]|nr:dehydrogenase [Psychromonas sp. MB-3u-54]